MTEAPVSVQPETDYSGVEDYWGTDERVNIYLPDGKQYFVIKPMNEGDKAKFQKMTSKDVILQQKTGDARMSVDPAGERHQLIKSSVVDWNLFKMENGVPQPVGYSKQILEKWLDSAPPKIVEFLEHKIRLANPWLQAEMTVEDIDEEIDRLTDLRKQVVDREAGEGASATK